MTAKDGLSKSEKIDILKRLIRKYSSSRLSRSEKISVLKRLVTKLSTSRLSKTEMAEIVKRIIKRYAANDPIKASNDLSDKSKKKN